jgi:hypothetical protein
MTITEPATLATDYLMAALAIYWARDLGAQRKLDWSRTFAALAAASFVGGTYHGFQGMMAEMVRQASWQATLVFSCNGLVQAGIPGSFGGFCHDHDWGRFFGPYKMVKQTLGGRAISCRRWPFCIGRPGPGPSSVAAPGL